MRRLRLLLVLLAALLTAACAADPSGGPGPDPGGKGDAPDDPPAGALPTTRRTLDHYACPDGAEWIPVAFFDADSTLRVAKSGDVSASAIDDVDILPFAAERIAALREQGFLIAVISNQGGVAAGHVTFEVAEGALAFTIAQLDAVGGRVDYFDMADRKDDFRKPEIGMAVELDERLAERCGAFIDLDASIMVGDSGYRLGVDGPSPDGRPADDFSNSDRLFAENLGIPFHEPTDFFGWRDFGVFNVAGEEELVAFLDAIDAEAARLDEQGEDDARAERLRAEAAAIRRVNGL